jgi:hypothetical protein
METKEMIHDAVKRNSNIINEAVTSLYKRNGRVTPSMVVEAAKPKTAPLHCYFEWNDKKAGHKFRLHQARRLIRVARVTVDGDKKEQLFHIPSITKAEGEYKPLSVVIEKINDFAAARQEFVCIIIAAKRSLQALDAAADGKGDEALARIAIAMQALETAREAVSTLQ